MLVKQAHAHHRYVFEPQSLQYLAHGDLWDHLYLQALQRPPIAPGPAGSLPVFLPLTLEMGSWLWVRKNPRQMFSRRGIFNPLIAAIFNAYIPDTGARYDRQSRNPITLVRDFKHCFTTLWKDKLGQVSLAVTTLFWGVGATLQFIVIAWAQQKLGYGLDRASMLQGVTALGIAIGAVLAARFVPLRRSLSVLPVQRADGTLAGLLRLHDLVRAGLDSQAQPTPAPIPLTLTLPRSAAA